MTARELSAFDQMFTMIFDSYTEMKSGGAALDEGWGVGKRRSLNGLADRLRQQSKNVKWTSEAHQELDRKKEAMDLCDTNQQLLNWAMHKVFAKS